MHEVPWRNAERGSLCGKGQEGLLEDIMLMWVCKVCRSVQGRGCSGERMKWAVQAETPRYLGDYHWVQMIKRMVGGGTVIRDLELKLGVHALPLQPERAPGGLMPYLRRAVYLDQGSRKMSVECPERRVGDNHFEVLAS